MGEGNQIPRTEATVSNDWNLYRTSGVAALITVLVMVLEMVITLLPGGSRGGVEAMTVTEWFDLFQESSFMGLRNLGLMNMLAIFFAIPMYVALYTIHRRGYGAVAALAGILGYLFLLLFDIFSSFVPTLFESAMLFVLIGGPVSLLWDVLIAVKFLKIGFCGRVAG